MEKFLKVKGRLQLSNTLNIGVLVSGGGTNLQSIIDACEQGFIPGKVVVVISNKKEAYALERAKKHNIQAIHLNPKDFSSRYEYYEKICNCLERKSVNLVCLAGFLLKVENPLLERFKGCIMNIHPALLPCFGGKGMYGHYVHEAVLESGAKFSGCTVHLVDEKYDHGPIIVQRIVPVDDNDTPESLAERVLKEEHKAFPEAIKLFAEGKIEVVGRRVIKI